MLRLQLISLDLASETQDNAPLSEEIAALQSLKWVSVGLPDALQQELARGVDSSTKMAWTMRALISAFPSQLRVLSIGIGGNESTWMSGELRQPGAKSDLVVITVPPSVEVLRAS